MGNKRIILYVLLGVIIMSLWNAWFAEHPSKKPVSTSVTATTPEVGPKQGSSMPSPAAVAATPSHGASDSLKNIHLQTSTVLTTVDSDLLHLVFNDQANLMQVALKKYAVSTKEKRPILLLNNKQQQYYQMQTGVVAANSTNNQPSNLVYTTSQTSYSIPKKASYIDVKFVGTNKNGLTVTKVYRIQKNSYAMDLSYTVKNKGQKPWHGSFYGQIQRIPPTAKKGTGLMGFHSYSGSSFSTVSKPYTKVSFSNLAKQTYANTTRGGWVAMQQHYFLSAWVPRAHDLNNYYGYMQNWNQQQLYTIGFSSNQVQLAPKQQTTGSAKFYVGPELVNQLDKVAPHLSLTIDYGWFWWLATPIFKVLSWVHSLVGNWGFSIIIITLLMQLLFYKLNEKSFTSMAKMRDAAPRIKQLQEQHGSDKAAAQKAMMEFYRKEKINPLGGCLPILVQIPVFIALYWVLGENVVLRQAPFILWIHDLSIRDPYFVLPVLMGVSMFLQQRLSPAPPDPTQAKMMMLMPVFMTAIFLFFPAGLVLYWLTRNVASITQQKFITKKINREKAQRKRKR